MKWFFSFLVWLLPFASSIEAKDFIAPSKERFLLFYSPYFVELLQVMYGAEGVISQGGTPSIEDLFIGVDLEGKDILDLGSGLGQVDIYLAKKHSARIIGVDCASYMVEQANKRLAKESSIIQDRVSFLVLQQSPTLQEFPNESFDLVFSKEVFYHLPAKEKFLYLQEIYRVLKPGGKVLIADWGQRGPSLTMQQAIRTENSCFLLHPEEFSQLLAQAHFQDVQVRDVTDQHLVYTREDLQRIDQNKYLLTKLDAYAYDHALTSCSLWLKALEEGSLLAEVFSATKPQQEK